jgi:hypothetical protein
MADELRTVSDHVEETTEAVVTMQSAVIAAETEAADQVCRHVNQGFFSMMCSQISQKMANRKSRVEALLLHLGQQRRQLLAVKSTMEREYARIAERYQRLFANINKELESRIAQVDQPIFRLVNKDMATSTNRMNALSGWVTTTQSEVLTEGQKISVSKMKHNAQDVLQQSTDFLKQIGQQRVLTDQTLITNPKGNRSQTFLVPVYIMEKVSDESGIVSTDVELSNFFDEEGPAVMSAVRRAEDLPWQTDGKLAPEIASAFLREVDALTKERPLPRLGGQLPLWIEPSPVKVKAMAIKLFQQMNCQTL